MILNLKTIADGRSVLSQRVRIEGEQASWLSCTEDFQCRAEIDNIQTQISVHLFYEGALCLECSRCLKRFDFPIKGDFYTIIKKRSPDHHHESTAEEDSDFLYDDETEELDMNGVLFEEIAIAVPMKPLCSETCPGMQVGENVATGTMEKKEIDPRWEMLKKFKST